ncbi:rod shape-determining protein RodA [Sporichthya brevicatena]|uniref:peptidoglycan glycosyltransferase n=1 Tax=Sporichthya brevicatena TaxID=171442 RepID=A0ABP3SDK0_9ACTN
MALLIPHARGTVRLPGRPAPERRTGHDLVLAAAVLALCAAGSVLVFSATRPRLQAAGDDPTSSVVRHLVSIVLGLGLAAVIALGDYRRLRMYAPLVYLLAIAGLALLLSPLGATVNGSHSWLNIAGISIQPVEFAKVALCLGLALVLAERREGTGTGFTHLEVFLACGLAAVPIALVALQPDLGSIMVLVAILAGVLVVAAVPARWIVGLAVTAVIGAVVVVQANLLSEYQVARFAAFANPNLDPSGVGYNANQARIAIGSGGLTGTGLFQGTQTGGKFVPEQHTDFIFTVAGEETGLIGAGAIVLLFALVVWRGCLIARRAPDLFGTLVAAAVVCWFGFQAFENIGMTLGLMPITGLPLPFLSYGGTAMLANFAAVGLLLNISANSSAAARLAYPTG